MKNKWIWIVLSLVMVLLIVGAYFLYNKLSGEYSPDNLTNTSSNQSSEEAKEPAPDFTVVDGDGKKVKLSDVKGKPVVINFWASWCPPCKAEMPDFEEMYKKYKDDVVFMMINATDGYQETVSTAKAHIKNCGYTFPVYFDTEYSASRAYYVSSLPATYFIDADGNIKNYAIGMISGERLEEGIKTITE